MRKENLAMLLVCLSVLLLSACHRSWDEPLKIIHSKADGYGTNLYVMNEDGGEDTALTSEYISVGATSWAADGKTIYFSRMLTSTGDCDIRAMNFSGTSEERIICSTGTYLADGISISADASKMAYSVYISSNYYITIINLSDLSVIASSISGQSPSFSPDGSRIVYSDNSTGYICFINSDGSNKQIALTASLTSMIGSFPSWSPDGTCIAYILYSNLFKVNVDGINQIQLTSNNFSTNPSWSPDGSRIIYSDSSTGWYQIFTLNADGSDKKQLTSGSTSFNFPCYQYKPH